MIADSRSWIGLDWSSEKLNEQTGKFKAKFNKSDDKEGSRNACRELNPPDRQKHPAVSRSESDSQAVNSLQRKNKKILTSQRLYTRNTLR